MNRRQKIIISVTGIFLVLLILVGLTYAYFLTQIEGNPNDESISVTTANLKVKYSDNSNELITSEEPIIPGEFTSSKTFTVTNEGNATSEYVVLLENMKTVYASTTEDVTAGSETSFIYPEDFRYTLTCTIESSNTTRNGTSCNGIQETGFPINGGVLVSNNIEEDDKHNYTLTLTYIDTGLDQSVDMNKKIEGKINIKDGREVNPYVSDTTLLANKIINNALNVTEEEKELGYVEFRTTPLTTPAVSISSETESELSMSADELGTTYYYRGNVKNNYVNFNNMCWRIVRIEGDGSIKLILEDQYDTCEQIQTDTDSDGKLYTGNWEIDWEIRGKVYGYSENSNGQTIANYENFSGGMKDELNTWLTNNISETNQNKLKSNKICIGNTNDAYDANGKLLTPEEKGTLISNPNNTTFYYKTYVRLAGYGQIANATYMCDMNGKSKNEYKISLLTVDEVVYAGGKLETDNYNYYLLNEYQRYGTVGNYATISVSKSYENYETIFSLDEFGWISTGTAISEVYARLRPSISILKSSAIYSDGNGSQLEPYVIE